ncbi:ABC transporter permease [Sinorhizobium sp. BG8]|uniref:FtsX-like permease family protein n=1 Tax=Sinorhizobium sp. BG8 TaxID=2613773 RepID=UPI00193D6FE6|nr:ABC transporter permease [Sinorhizobium sp. BG8]QRM53610.1 ABC transporter permease [Sinorhizobium sp. BG8]
MIGFIIADMRRLWAGCLAVVLLVALATALVVAVNLQERALRLGTARAADHFDLVIGAAGSETQLVLSSVFLQPSPLPLMDGAILSQLAADPRVAWVAPIGFGDSVGTYPIVGTTNVLIDNLSAVAEGMRLSKNSDAVVGSAVAIPLGFEIKPMHGMASEGGHTHTEHSYRVVGRLAPTGTAWDRAVMVPIDAVWALHGMAETGHAAEDADADHDHHDGLDEEVPVNPVDETGAKGKPGVPAVLVKPKSIADAYKLRQEYRTDRTLAVFPGEVLTNLYASLGDARAILAIVAIGAQGLVAAALLLVTVVHLGQRRRQIAALRALGAPRFAISTIVWSQLFVLFALGIGLGFYLGYGATVVVSRYLTSESGVLLPVEFAVGDWWEAAALIGFAALLSALPALLAYRQSPANALRA